MNKNLVIGGIVGIGVVLWMRGRAQAATDYQASAGVGNAERDADRITDAYAEPRGTASSSVGATAHVFSGGKTSAQGATLLTRAAAGTNTAATMVSEGTRSAVQAIGALFGGSKTGLIAERNPKTGAVY